ncbi:MAG: hypothetical protein U0166_25350 [Acidobacteriota bacterium]
MAATIENLSSDVKKLKAELAALRTGGAAKAASKRKKKPLSEARVLRIAKKRLRRASGRLQVQKLKASRKAKGAEAPKEAAPAT